MTTSTTPAPEKWSRAALLIEGLAAAAFGIAVLVWPAKTAVALTGVIALWAIVAGVVYAVMGFVSKSLGTGGRVGHVLLGILYVVAGIYTFSARVTLTPILAVFLVIMVGVMWMMEGFTALFTLGRSGSTALTVVFAIISILAGFSLLTSPLWGAVFLWWFLGIGLAVLGVLNIIRAIIGKKN